MIVAPRPDHKEMADFRKVLAEFEPLDAIPADQRTPQQEADWDELVETLWREHSSPWLQWPRGSQEQQAEMIQQLENRSAWDWKQFAGLD
jgi:hypothetical protein